MDINTSTQIQRYKKYYLRAANLLKTRKEVVAYVEITFTIFTFSFFVFFAIRPTLTTIAGLNSDIRSQEDIDNRLEQKVTALRAAYNNYTQIQSQLPLLDQALPPYPQAADFLRQTEALASSNSLTLETLTFDLPSSPLLKGSQTTGQIKFTLTTSGSYSNLNQFLASFESLRRIAFVDTFSFTSPEKQSTVVLSLTGTIPYLLPDSPSPTPVSESVSP